MKKPILEPAQEFATIKEILRTTVKKHAKNIAFIIKKKEEKKVTYTNITYEKFGKDKKEGENHSHSKW